ncbi:MULTISPECIES: hypothetical protein [unclassified Mesorhizobium]|uniref:hypothetical protein n=1 Tax=unclassified Mesorhizobium TaxID=325217 RepID=UPI000FC9EFD8|nr:MULTISPECIES: hypothetical protein [unclassified Mesorhizobium]RUU63942.1 hypothetical protein EOC99_13750 [Mesorhizobium sp. M7A.T.Ca.TU.009.01.1.1]RUU75836.1 hypothetical protein EOD03_24390 [Mesorhizobium sp. M7A.T.Ca.TU.009.01.1.2]RWO42435.1 MAG: hypothetical protein EOS12_21000 [Mesorhizobium sp.]RUT83526.1 hypothetical protein EOD15_29705 [Mesorhizobium sp. M7A.T.Ca.US.000.02.2.1]RUT84623.1 hypothetical protein EOD14_20165 [Mesorhizobium sp. M7A.T.Ca.US.000.02.1.1]
MTRLVATLFFAAIFACPAVPALAEQCAARADMIKALGEKFHESEAARGLVNPSLILEIFVSDRGTWTILATDTHGQSCVITAGEGWDGSLMAAAALPGT